jgi:hypothetical protein
VTEPVGVPDIVAVTVAVIVTDWPTNDGLGVAVSTAVVGDTIEKLVVFVDSVSPEPLTLQYLMVWLPSVETLRADE